MLPTVAVRTVMDGGAVTLGDAWNLWKLVMDAGCKKHGVRADTPEVADRDVESLAGPRNVGDQVVAQLDPIRPQLLASETEQLERLYAIPREVAVERPGGCVAWRSGVAYQYPA